MTDENFTYLTSKTVIDNLLKNKDFIELARRLTKTMPATTLYKETFEMISKLLLDNGFDSSIYLISIVKSSGVNLYDNWKNFEESISSPNQNMTPEIILTLSFYTGLPASNSGRYPFSLQSSIQTGYGFSQRYIDDERKTVQFCAKVYNGRDVLNPTSFTLRVGQYVSI